MRSSGRSPWLVPVVVAFVATGALALAITRTQILPDGPQPIAWDRAACAHCHMHVSEHAFASQLQLDDGRVLDFDDPGCLLSFVATEQPSIHAAWFHHLKEDRWLDRARAGFVAASPTPMGFDLGAVDATVPGAMPFEQALARVASGSPGRRE